MKRYLPYIAAALAVVAVIAMWSVRSAKKAVEEVAEAVGDVEVDVTMKGVELSRGADGRTEWRLKATGADYAQESGRVRVTNPRITYYPVDGDGEIQVNATEGEVDQQSGAAHLWPDVSIVSGPSLVTAGRLDYDSAARGIVLTENVRLNRPGMSLTASKVVLDLKTNDISAEGGVESMLYEDPVRQDKE